MSVSSPWWLTRQAIAEARLDLAAADRERMGVFIGSGMGGALTTDEGYLSLYRDGCKRVKPFSDPHGHEQRALGVDRDRV